MATMANGRVSPELIRMGKYFGINEIKNRIPFAIVLMLDTFSLSISIERVNGFKNTDR